jgi:outer membrane protein
LTLSAEQELAEKRGGFHPEIDIIAGYTVSKNDDVAVESLPTVRKSGVGIQFKYPLYRGGLTTAEVKTGKLKYEKSIEDFELARREVIGKVRNSFRKVNNDVKGVQAAELSTHSSEKSLEASEAGYKNGTRPLGIVLKAQNDLFKARKEHSKARYNYILDSLRLKYHVGTLAIEDIQVVNSWLNTDKLILPPEISSTEEVKVDLFY